MTDLQIAKIERQARAAGLYANCENCHTGSAYIAIYLPEWCTNIDNELLLQPQGWEEKKIRLSGHDEGHRQDSTHDVVGSKSECLAALKQWLAEIIEVLRPEATAIIAARPEGTLADDWNR